jgi:hypothetical protein
MGSKLMTAGCFLGAMLGILSLRSAATTDAQRVFRLSIAGLALMLMLTGGVLMLRESRKSGG